MKAGKMLLRSQIDARGTDE